ncbi:fungal-specific transcription factor domain-containing protein [Mycena floridula]|nr:fungal-specific transcription factor domain-containing protein [Mycena floridula]
MPPDTAKPSSSRRPKRQLTEEELKDIEEKRIKGELSCAECRRLKLRCDKKLPCSSCVRRGCESICPCGILSAGQGTRFILADTDHLHRKISDMSQRIRQLEDGLGMLQATVSGTRHPLLSEELLRIKFGSEVHNAPAAQASHTDAKADPKPPATESIEGLGTLTLDSEGEMKYFGRTGGPETLMVTAEEWDTGSEQDDSLPDSLNVLANLFPFTKTISSSELALETIESYLPKQERALALCNSYLDHASLFFRPIKKDELFEEFMPNIYAAAAWRAKARAESANQPSPAVSDNTTSNSTNSSHKPTDNSSAHAVATLYFLFGLGALFDLNLPECSAEAEHYFDLGRAALGLRPVLDSPQVSTIRAVGLLATFRSIAAKKYTRSSAWCAMSLATKLAQSIGLHRDPARWGMDPKTVQRRRTLWWEVLTADISHSSALGRPPAIHLSFVDCEFPTDEEATLSQTGEVQYGFWCMKYTFARDIFMPLVEATLAAKPPSYATILDIDKKVRAITFPDSFKAHAKLEDGVSQFYSSSLSLRDFYATMYRTVVMQYLHRSFFAQAMLDHPNNPFLSPFSPSFLTACRVASIIIKAGAHQFQRCERMAMRVWFLMCQVFSASVVLGTLLTRAPNSNIAPAALLDLNLAVEMFERSAPYSQKSRTALVVLHKLRDKAIRSYAQFSSATLLSNPSASDFSNIFPAKAENDQDELAIFGGQTRVLTKKTRPKPGTLSPTSTPSPSLPASSDSPSSSLNPLDSISSLEKSGISRQEVHPALMEFLTTMDGMDFTMESPPVSQPQSARAGSSQLLFSSFTPDSASVSLRSSVTPTGTVSEQNFGPLNIWDQSSMSKASASRDTFSWGPNAFSQSSQQPPLTFDPSYGTFTPFDPASVFACWRWGSRLKA